MPLARVFVAGLLLASLSFTPLLATDAFDRLVHCVAAGAQIHPALLEPIHLAPLVRDDAFLLPDSGVEFVEEDAVVLKSRGIDAAAALAAQAFEVFGAVGVQFPQLAFMAGQHLALLRKVAGRILFAASRDAHHRFHTS